MNKKLLALIVLFGTCINSTAFSLTIQKSAPVAKKETPATMDSAAGVLSTVMGVVTTVQQLDKKQKELSAECVPSSQEVAFVDKMVREWAKTGAASADDIASKLGRQPCASSATGYEYMVKEAYAEDSSSAVCFNTYRSSADAEMVWNGFPKVGKTYVCTNGEFDGCGAKHKKDVSDIYEIFGIISFTEKDMVTSEEVTMWAKLTEKAEKCTDAKIKAKQKQAYGEFITNTINNFGKPTNTDVISEQVKSIVGSGGGLGGLGNIGNVAAQLLNK